MSRSRKTSERGESLVELLVTIAIISIAVVALVGALADTISASSSHRQHATAETVARNVAEALKNRNTPYVPSGVYPPSAWSSVNTTGYNVTANTTCWNAPTNPATFSASLNCTSFLQQIKVTATSPAKGEKESVVILKRKVA
jgi:type II secretory pathway pseudopilin PulG